MRSRDSRYRADGRAERGGGQESRSWLPYRAEAGSDPLQDTDHPIGQVLDAVRMGHLDPAFRRDPRDALFACCAPPIPLPGQAIGPGEEGLESVWSSARVSTLSPSSDP